MNDKQIINGHTARASAYMVDNFPYAGDLLTRKLYWLETVSGSGDTLYTITIDPATGRENTMKSGSPAVFRYFFINQAGHFKIGCCSFSNPAQIKEQMAFILDAVGEKNINDAQKENIRFACFRSLLESARQHRKGYSAEQTGLFLEWLAKVAIHFVRCPFRGIPDYPPEPLCGQALDR